LVVVKAVEVVVVAVGAPQRVVVVINNINKVI
jgi:hypothetical protein